MDLDLRQALDVAVARVGGWLEAAVAGLPNLIAALLVGALFWVAAGLLRRTLRSALSRVTAREIARLLAGVAYGAVLAMGLFVALGILNLDKTVTSLLAGAGILGLALGFAFQDTAENFISGLLLSIRRPFTDGDVIESNDRMGIVEHINMRATVIRTFSGQRVVLPNSQVFKNPLTNYSAYGTRRVEVGCGVSYGDDLEKARRVAREAVEALPARDSDREVEVFFSEFGDSSINFELRFWIDFGSQADYLQARSEAIMRIKRAFDAQGISIPFPIRTLDFGADAVGGVRLSEPLSGGAP